MSSILAALRAAPGATGGLRCAACLWLGKQSKGDQAEWAEAMLDRSFTNRAIALEMGNRTPDGELRPTYHSVRGHRSQRHGVKK